MIAVAPTKKLRRVSRPVDRLPAVRKQALPLRSPQLSPIPEATAQQQRLESLLSRRIEFIASPEFDAKDADRLILGTAEATLAIDELCPEPTQITPRSASLPPYVASLYEVPLLTATEEYNLFRRFNYLKFLAAREQARLPAKKPTTKQLDRLENLLKDAAQAKLQLVRSNLRLVVSLAKRFSDANSSFDDLVSDGNLLLLRAVEKFNYALGNRFSTYATHAIQRGYFRTVARQRQWHARYVADDESLRTAADREASTQLGERQVSCLRQSFNRMLSHLDQREQLVVCERFGFNDAPPKTFQELGVVMGVCKERVRQIQARAMSKLRSMAGTERLDQLFDELPH